TSDRRRIAFVDEANVIRIRDLVDQKEVARLDGHKEPIHKLLFTPDGQRLLWGSANDFCKPVDLLVWDLSKKEIVARVPGVTGPGNRFILSDDGRFLAVGTRSVNESTSLTVWRLSDGAKLQSLDKLGWNTPVAFSPDGQRLAIVES